MYFAWHRTGSQDIAAVVTLSKTVLPVTARPHPLSFRLLSWQVRASHKAHLLSCQSPGSIRPGLAQLYQPCLSLSPGPWPPCTVTLTGPPKTWSVPSSRHGGIRSRTRCLPCSQTSSSNSRRNSSSAGRKATRSPSQTSGACWLRPVWGMR